MSTATKPSPVRPSSTKSSTRRSKKAEAQKLKGYVDPPVAAPWERRTRQTITVDIAEIFIPAAQREEKPNAASIKGKFEPARMDPILVNVRKPLQGLSKETNTNAWEWESQQPAEAKYALTDGFQRITALKGMGFTKVEVATIEASVEYENWYFRHQDIFKRKLDRGDQYSSKLATDDPMTLVIDSIVRSNGFYVKNKLTKKGPYDIPISSPTGPEDTFRYDYEGVVLDRVLKIISNCWSGYDKAGHHDIIRGVGRFVVDYGDKITPEVEAIWRNRVQIGSLLEATEGGGSQPKRAQRVAQKLLEAAKIHRKRNALY